MNPATWTERQAIEFSIIVGVLGASIVVGALMLLSRWAHRLPLVAHNPPRTARIDPETAWAAPEVVPVEGRSLVRVADVTNCARCGGSHARRLFLPFTRPPAGMTHYTVCPATEEPILAQITPDLAPDWPR